ncbi:MAG: DUF1330 domain-containing protein [Polymorphobacter sp.]
MAGTSMDRSIDPTADQVRALRDKGPDGPIIMLNLLKFKAQATYPPEAAEPPCSGAAAYSRYQAAFSGALQPLTQAEILYDGPVGQVFIGLAGTLETDWDKVLLVRYPSRGHFLGMMANADYRLALAHRYAGLARTVLLQCGA